MNLSSGFHPTGTAALPMSVRHTTLHDRPSRMCRHRQPIRGYRRPTMTYFSYRPSPLLISRVQDTMSMEWQLGQCPYSNCTKELHRGNFFSRPHPHYQQFVSISAIFLPICTPTHLIYSHPTPLLRYPFPCKCQFFHFHQHI